MFKNKGLKKQILALVILLSSFTFISGIISFIAFEQVTHKYDHVAHVNLPNTAFLGTMLSELRKIRIGLRTLGIQGVTPAQSQTAIKEVEDGTKAYEAADKAYNDIPFVPGEQALYDEVNNEWKKFKVVGANILAFQKAGTPADLAKMREIFFGDCMTVALAYRHAITKLLDFQTDQSKAWVKQAENANTIGMIILLAVSLGGLAAGLFIGFRFSSSLTQSIGLTAESLSRGSDGVASAAQEIAATSHSLSSGATEQAAAIQETAASVQELTATAATSAENAKNSIQLASESQNSATEGKKVVGDMINAIGEINASNNDIMVQIQESNREISEITKVIVEIGNKTKVINDIVFQTKLLSFNASVEAARAGEHGKGFAVVAEEVGNLAQMSGNAAKEISALLEGSIDKVQSIVQNTQTKVEHLISSGKSKVEAGTVIAKRCGEVLDGLVSNVSQVSQMVGHISAATEEQARGADEISNAMNELNKVTQQNTAASEQSSSASGSLAKDAENLRNAVAELLSIVNGQQSPQPLVEKMPKQHSKQSSKVIHFTQKKERHQAVQEPFAQIKPGASGELPAHDDQRFKDV